MNALEQLTDKINRNPEQPVTMADLKILLTEARELAEWIQVSNKVINRRLVQMQKKCDSSYVFGSSEASLRQSVTDLEKRQRDMERIISKITNRIG
jgi:hypothetical protein